MNSVSTKPSVSSPSFGGMHRVKNDNISAAFLATGLFIASAAGAATGVGVVALCKPKKSHRRQKISSNKSLKLNRNSNDSDLSHVKKRSTVFSSFEGKNLSHVKSDSNSSCDPAFEYLDLSNSS